MHNSRPRSALRQACLLLACAILAAGTQARAAAVCVHKTFESDSFLVCPFDLRTQEFRILSTDAKGEPLRGFDALSDALGTWAARVRFAMNAGMFDENGHAIGLLVENGTQRHSINTANGPGNFHMKPNGVFSLDEDGTLRAETTDAYLARAAAPVWATQSGPMLVIKGRIHPSISNDGQSHHIRNGVGVHDAHTAYFAISEDLVSFGKLARFFRDKLACKNALYFDGSVSSIWVPSLKRKDTGYSLGPLIVALDR